MSLKMIECRRMEAFWRISYSCLCLCLCVSIGLCSWSQFVVVCLLEGLAGVTVMVDGLASPT